MAGSTIAPSSRPVTVVTGGSRGIGAATCVRLASEGHDLALGFVSNAEAAGRTAAAARSAGARCVTVRVDTAVEADVERLFDTAADRLGPVTGLVNNAGVTGPLGRLVDTSTETLRRVIDVNLLGYLMCCRRAAKDMAARGSGAIVNVSSAAATLGGPGDFVHYAATKAATDALTVGLSKELGPDGVRVNAVAPGMIDTEMHATAGDPDRANAAASGIPLGRPGAAPEIASAIAWLLSDEASYVTGAVLRVAGGR
ncbi:SDR family oxidoreductase [Streptomyces sp. NBC_01217]|uniref:SDR family oxidoreductase n=1 Tax=Streptomyces sp. NBC_01217 TaxID=2903779 RepID=UPI002E0F70FA|nr:SDR family oxidoreductase [Streptomyces sp. NBC_01217]